MKNIFKISLGLLACLSVFSACNDEDEGIVAFQVDKTEITVGAEGAEEYINVTSGTDWIAVASEPWIMLSPANGIGSAQCRVAIDTTLIEGMRSGTIKFASNGQPAQVVTVNQTGFGTVIALDKKEIEIKASDKKADRYFEIKVTTNVQFNITCTDENGAVDWVTTKKKTIDLDYGARPRTAKIRFDWNTNTNPEARQAKIEFKPVNPEHKLKEPVVLNLTQLPAPLIEDNRLGDSLALMILQEKMNTMANIWDGSENMRNWDNVELWEDGDKDMPMGAEGRVRSVAFMLLDTEEGIPQEISHLKYLESLSVQSNTNTMLKSIELGSDICELEHLKKLTIFAYGIVKLPHDFYRLKSLEYLDLSANNFESIPAVINEDNFPNLKGLRMVANRRWTCADLREASTYKDGIGMHIEVDKDGDNDLRRLFLWESLEQIILSNNYIEGSLPDFEIGVDGVRAYDYDDIAAMGDTLKYLVEDPEGQKIPRILPNLKRLALNLNFLSGELPKWMLYHPYLMEWIPNSLVYPQQEKGINSAGKIVKFSNIPATYDYYYDAFPMYRAKYEMKDEYEE